MTDADDRVKELAEGLCWPLSDRQRTAENIATFVRSELAAHEAKLKAMFDNRASDFMILHECAYHAQPYQPSAHEHAHHGTGEHTEAEMRAVLAQGKRDLPPAADPPAVEHKPHCKSTLPVCSHRGCATCPKAGEANKTSESPEPGTDGSRPLAGGGSEEPALSSAPDREAPKPAEVPATITVAVAWGRALSLVEPGQVVIGAGVEVSYVPLSALTEALGVLRDMSNALPNDLGQLGMRHGKSRLMSAIRRAQALLARHGVRS